MHGSTGISPVTPPGAGWLVVDHHGLIHQSRGHAATLLEEADGLVVEGGALSTWRPSCAGRLLASIGAACDDPGLRPMALTIERRSGLLAYQVVVSPRPGEPGRATVVVSDPCDRGRDFSRALADAYELTVAEAAVASLLVSGLDVQQIAERRAVSHFTVRALLKRVFVKTGVTRQVDLVRLVLAGAIALGAEPQRTARR